MACWWSTPRAFPSLAPSRGAWRASGVAGSARSTTGKWPSLWATCRARARRWSTCGGLCPKPGPRPRLAETKRAGPWPTAGLARGPSWREPGGRPVARGSHRGGARAMMRWDGRTGVVAGSLAWGSALGWRCRARRGAVPRRPRCRRPAGGAVPRGLPGNTSRGGVPRWTRTPGSGSTCATAPKGRWGSTRSNDVGWRGRRGGNKATRTCESCYATATATIRRWCRALVICPTPRLRHRWGSWPAWPQPHIASTPASSAARVQPGERTMRAVMGQGGISTNRWRASPHGFG